MPHVHVHCLPRRAGDFAVNDEVYDAIDERARAHRLCTLSIFQVCLKTSGFAFAAWAELFEARPHARLMFFAERETTSFLITHKQSICLRHFFLLQHSCVSHSSLAYTGAGPAG